MSSFARFSYPSTSWLVLYRIELPYLVERKKSMSFLSSFRTVSRLIKDFGGIGASMSFTATDQIINYPLSFTYTLLLCCIDIEFIQTNFHIARRFAMYFIAIRIHLCSSSWIKHDAFRNWFLIYIDNSDTFQFRRFNSILLISIFKISSEGSPSSDFQSLFHYISTVNGDVRDSYSGSQGWSNNSHY